MISSCRALEFRGVKPHIDTNWSTIFGGFFPMEAFTYTYMPIFSTPQSLDSKHWKIHMQPENGGLVQMNFRISIGRFWGVSNEGFFFKKSPTKACEIVWQNSRPQHHRRTKKRRSQNGRPPSHDCWFYRLGTVWLKWPFACGKEHKFSKLTVDGWNPAITSWWQVNIPIIYDGF